jgi:hypothetical protein
MVAFVEKKLAAVTPAAADDEQPAAAAAVTAAVLDPSSSSTTQAGAAQAQAAVLQQQAGSSSSNAPGGGIQQLLTQATQRYQQQQQQQQQLSAAASTAAPAAAAAAAAADGVRRGSSGSLSLAERLKQQQQQQQQQQEAAGPAPASSSSTTPDQQPRVSSRTNSQALPAAAGTNGSSSSSSSSDSQLLEMAIKQLTKDRPDVIGFATKALRDRISALPPLAAMNAVCAMSELPKGWEKGLKKPAQHLEVVVGRAAAHAAADGAAAGSGSLGAAAAGAAGLGADDGDEGWVEASSSPAVKRGGHLGAAAAGGSSSSSSSSSSRGSSVQAAWAKLERERPDVARHLADRHKAMIKPLMANQQLQVITSPGVGSVCSPEHGSIVASKGAAGMLGVCQQAAAAVMCPCGVVQVLTLLVKSQLDCQTRSIDCAADGKPAGTYIKVTWAIVRQSVSLLDLDAVGICLDWCTI